MVTKDEAALRLREMGIDAEVVKMTYGEVVMVYGLDYKAASKALRAIGYDASMGVRPGRGSNGT